MQDGQQLTTEELVNRSITPEKTKERFDVSIAFIIFAFSVYGAFELTKYLKVQLGWRIAITIIFIFAVMFFSLGLSKKS